MITKNIITGFVTGIFSTLLGMLVYIVVFSDLGVISTLTDARQKDYLGKVISLGALLNFLPFFLFLKKGRIYHARGVLLATLVSAIVIAFYKFL